MNIFQQVNTDGALSFTKRSKYTDDEFPVTNMKLIAPFWADVDTRGIGNVTYRVTTNAELLWRANGDIGRTFLDRTFLSSYLLITTWDHVGYYDAQSKKVKHVHPHVPIVLYIIKMLIYLPILLPIPY